MSNTIFTKDIEEHFSVEETSLIFKNNLDYFSIAQSVENLHVPQPLSVEGTVLSFEFLEGMGKTLSHQWFKGEMWKEDIIEEIGLVLGQVHLKRGDINQKIFLHGDFMPHNIVIQNEKVIFFDFEPPALHDDFYFYYNNYNYVDIASFVLSILITHSFKKPFIFFKNKKGFVQAFLRGYEKGASCSLDNHLIKNYLDLHLDKWYGNSHHSQFERIVKKFFLKTVVFFQKNVYNVLT